MPETAHGFDRKGTEFGEQPPARSPLPGAEPDQVRSRGVIRTCRVLQTGLNPCLGIFLAVSASDLVAPDPSMPYCRRAALSFAPTPDRRKREWNDG